MNGVNDMNRDAAVKRHTKPYDKEHEDEKRTIRR